MFKYNPLTGVFELYSPTRRVEYAEKVSATFSCDEATVIGDLVVPSTTTEDTVLTIKSNVYSGLVIGVVINKPTPDTCEVLATGKLGDISGVEFGKPMFVGTNGKLTTTCPTTGHKQIMGMTLTSSSAFLLPSTEKVVRA